MLHFKRAYICASPINLADKNGIRIDRVIVAEVSRKFINHTITLAYSYQLRQRKLKAEFKFDMVPWIHRMVWAHKEECRFHGDDLKRA
eukprot:CAMPEP_0201284858 /NCGR_PEP_ID=MMETSP1317-20130820/87210_1 /ASSEMBLY_ACC=CAM_ASM_000770 /TAXON_ID=187299 /ORGANISM="Undescribed Undescribed, Strain Undescribed" /LENGTH=87 /DNA_ID=CAMNT_0047606787 /DNA_START=260 /DNA_END=523 /DNA_ORIENTATION=+